MNEYDPGMFIYHYFIHIASWLNNEYSFQDWIYVTNSLLKNYTEAGPIFLFSIQILCPDSSTSILAS